MVDLDNPTHHVMLEAKLMLTKPCNLFEVMELLRRPRASTEVSLTKFGCFLGSNPYPCSHCPSAVTLNGHNVDKQSLLNEADLKFFII